MLTTTQQFSIASGVAVIGAVFYEVIGGAPTRASFVTGLTVVAWVDVALLVIAAALTFLLPRRPRRGRHAYTRWSKRGAGQAMNTAIAVNWQVAAAQT